MLRFVPTFIVSIFLSLNFGALLYLHSAFLGRFFSDVSVSLLFLAAAAANIILFLVAPRLLSAYGKEKLLFAFLVLTLVGTLGLAHSDSGLSAALFFIVYESFIFMAYWVLDIFLEKESSDAFTGEIRGIYWTFLNIGIAAGPFLGSFLADGDRFKPIFFAAAFLLALPLAISVPGLFRRHKKHDHAPHSLPFRAWWKARNVRAVTLAKLVLEVFYGVMVIYTPLYLHNHLGFSWSELGVIFSIALLPFVLLEWPAGELADRYWGEKEMMSAGFFITGTMLLLMPFIGKVFILWAAVLFTSRIGAALIEITTESYFFKKINASQTGFLSIFRLVRPAGLILGAVLGAFMTNLLPFSALFLGVAIVVFMGLKESLYLKDTL